MQLRISVMVAAAVLGGCVKLTVLGHTVSEGPAEESRAVVTEEPAKGPGKETAVKTTTVQPYRSVVLALAPEAQPKASNESGFSVVLFRETIEAELKSRGMLDAQNPRAGGAIQIQIDDFSVRATSNAVVFGFVPSAGTLAGTVRVADGTGAELRSFKVLADSVLSIPKGGNSDGKALQNLYRRFAILTADSLAETPATR